MKCVGAVTVSVVSALAMILSGCGSDSSSDEFLGARNGTAVNLTTTVAPNVDADVTTTALDNSADTATESQSNVSATTMAPEANATANATANITVSVAPEA